MRWIVLIGLIVTNYIVSILSYYKYLYDIIQKAYNGNDKQE